MPNFAYSVSQAPRKPPVTSPNPSIPQLHKRHVLNGIQCSTKQFHIPWRQISIDTTTAYKMVAQGRLTPIRPLPAEKDITQNYKSVDRNKNAPVINTKPRHEYQHQDLEEIPDFDQRITQEDDLYSPGEEGLKFGDKRPQLPAKVFKKPLKKPYYSYGSKQSMQGHRGLSSIFDQLQLPFDNEVMPPSLSISNDELRKKKENIELRRVEQWMACPPKKKLKRQLKSLLP